MTKRVCVIEGEDASPEAMRPTLGLLEGWQSPTARRSVVDSAPARYALKVISEAGSARVIRFAFEPARQRKEAGHSGKVTCSSKYNMLPRATACSATLLSAAMMLDYLGFLDAARALEAAVEKVYAEGWTLTPDQGGHAGTGEFCGAVARHL